MKNRHLLAASVLTLLILTGCTINIVLPGPTQTPAVPGATANVQTAPAPTPFHPPQAQPPAVPSLTGISPVASGSAGCTQHVALNGNDASAGSAQAPWRTIQHAADSAPPGSTVCIHGGTYAEGQINFTRSGTAAAPTTFTTVSGEIVALQGKMELSRGTAYLNLNGLNVSGYDIWGVTLIGDNHHIRLSRLVVSGGEAGIRLTEGFSGEAPASGPVGDVLIEDSIIRDVAATAVDCTPGPCDRVTFRRLEISGSGLSAGFGGDGLGLEKGRDVLVEDCYIHDNGGDGIDLNSRDTAGNVPGILVRRNRVVRNHLQGIKLWAGGRMENNLVWGQGINPVMVGKFPGTVQVVNNLIAYNMWDKAFSERDYAFIAAYPENGASPPVILLLVNNVFAFNTGPAVGSPTGIYLGPGVKLTEHHNLYWSREDGEIQAEFVKGRDSWFSRADIAGGVWTEFTGQGQQDRVADPLFTAGWPQVDLHSSAASPVRNAGSSNGAPSDDIEGHTRGTPPDIGAYNQ